MTDPADNVIVELSKMQEIADKVANYDRVELILRGYFAQHAENREGNVCPCRWCLEARAFLS